jgi:superfamily II DNA/RNA helicase
MALTHFRSEIYKNASKLGINIFNTLQTESIQGILASKNSIIIGEPGIGKSMSYIIGLSQLISINPNSNSSRYLSEDSLNSLFIKPSVLQKGNKHGAIVLVPTQELSFQIYKYFRLIAPWLNVFRTNSSITEVAGTLKFINQEIDEEQMAKQRFHSIASGVEWEILDVLISTPKLLNDILNYRMGSRLSGFDPRTIVIDEMDLIIE